MVEMSVDSGRNSCNHFCKNQRPSSTVWSSRPLPGLGRGSSHGHPLSPTSPSFSCCKPLPGVYRGPQLPGLERLPPRRADVPLRLPADAVRAAAHVQTQGAADEAANGRHWPGVQKGEPRGRSVAFPLFPACPSSHTDVPAEESHVTELSSAPPSTLIHHFSHSCSHCTLTFLVISVRPCVIRP